MPGRTTSVAFLGNDRDLNAVADRVAAKLRATAGVADEANAKMAASSEAAGAKIGEAYTAGTSKAAAALGRLSAAGAAFGIPMVKSLDEVGKKLDETSAKHQKLLGTMAQAGKVTLGAGIAGFAAAAYEGTKGAMALQTQMERIHTQAGVAQSAIAGLTSSVTKLAGPLGTSPTALADSLYHVESAGFRGQQALNIMSTAAKEAKVSGADLTDTTTALTASVFSGIKGAQDYTQAMGLLNATVGAGDMKFQDLNEALGGPMLATVKGYGLSLRDVGASLATLGDLNIRGADAATELRMAVQYMAKPAATAGPLLEKLGLSVHSFADAMAKGGLMPALDLLHQKLAAAGVQSNQMGQVIGDLFTKKGAAGITILENALDKLHGKFGQVGSGTNQLKSSWNAYTQTAQAKADQLKASVQALGDKFGMWLIPKELAVVSAIQSVVGWMEKHKAVAEALAAVIGGVLATAVAAYAYTKAVAFVGATKSMVGALATLVETVGAAAQALALKFSLMVASATGASAAISTAIGMTGVGLVVVGLGVAVGELMTHWDSVMKAMGNAAQDMAQVAKSALNDVIDALNKAIDAFNSTIGQLTGQIGHIGQIASGSSRAGMFDTANGLAPFAAPSFSTASGGPVSVPSSGSNAMRIAGALKAQGFSNNAIAGILGNFAQENGGQTLSGISTNAGPGGVGIAQWIGARATEEASYAAIHHESPTSLAAQVGFLVQELRTGYHGVFNQIQNAKTPQQAALLFEQGYERAGIPNNAVRESVAAQAYAMLTGSSSSSASGGSHSLSTSGLDALLNSTGNGTKTRAAKAIRTLLYANPFPGGATVGRTDQGVDFSATPGSPVDAIGAGVVKAIINNWYKGQPLIEEQLTQGPNKGQYVYYAEQIRSLVHLGQQVSAGQRIGTVAPSGTGLELGFGASGGRTLAKATTGYTEGQQTPAGKAFAAFLKSIGSGVYTTTSGGITTGGGQNFGIAAAQAIQQFIQSLQKATNSLIQSYQSLEQSGTVRTLTKALGVSTAGAMTTANAPLTGPGSALLNWAQPTTTEAVATVIRNAIEKLNVGTITSALNAGKDPHQLDSTLIPILEKASANSQATRSFNLLVAQLRASGQGGQANALTSARGGAFTALAQEMYAEQVTKDAESLALETTQLKDQTQLQSDTDSAMLAIHKAQTQKMADELARQTTLIRDMTTTVQDRFAGVVQAIQDATQRMTDSSDAVVQGIQDSTQVQVDILGERGLYGLNLIAQKEQVQLDIMKAGFDQQIAAAQLNLDQVTATANAADSTARLNLDQVTTMQDQLVAMAQQRVDTVTIAQNVKILAAQQAMDTVTLHEDMSVVGPAQTAVDLGATLPKAQQDVLNGILKRAQGQAGVAEAQAGGTGYYTDASGNVVQGYQGVNAAAQRAIDGANESLTKAQGTADRIIAGANQTLVTVTGQGNQAIADANQALQGIKDTAAQAEGTLQGVIDVTKAQASTQFAGTGTVVNVYGIPADNAAAIGDALDWIARTQLGALS